MANIGFNEDLRHEFKSDLAKIHDEAIVENIVALANTDGGALYLGVEDDGEITGIHKEHFDYIKLCAMIGNKTVPSQSVRGEMIDGEKSYLKLSVARSLNVVSTKSGKMFRRRMKAQNDPEKVLMYPYEIISRLSSISQYDFSSKPVPQSTMDDLSGVERERLRQIISTYNHSDKSLLTLDDEELDRALQLVSTENGETVPTFTGLLLIGKVESIQRLIPTNGALFQVLSDTDVKLNETIKLPILSAFERITGFFDAWNSEEEMEVGLFRIGIPRFSKRAFREALVNAFSHRDYTMLGDIRIAIDDDGMTIANPGGFIAGIDINNLINAEPHGRNPVLADALKRIGLAEHTGRGIDRIFEGSLQYGRSLPDYSFTTDVSVSLYISSAAVDKPFVAMLSEEQNRRGKELSLVDLLVLNSLKNRRNAAVSEVQTDVNFPEARVKSTLENLLESGLVEARGNTRSRTYMLSEQIYKNAEKSIANTLQKDIEEVRYPELIIALAKKRREITRSDIVKLLHITPSQAYRQLNKLVRSGKLILEGNGRSSVYKIKG